jgi:DNA-binding transcriptional LysR family regulator
VFEPPLPVDAPEIQMYWHSRHDRTPAQNWLRGLVREICRRF